MLIATKKIRPFHAPLDIVASIQCETPASSFVQVFDPDGPNGPEFSPDRRIMPLVLQPVVQASAPDGSWPNGRANARLANIKFFSNSRPIDQDPLWSGLFNINCDDDDLKGRITISRNLSVGEVLDFWMEADIPDPRSESIHHIKSDSIQLRCVEAQPPAYSLDLSGEDFISYDPVSDPLAIDDFDKAHDKPGLSSSGRLDAVSAGLAYLRPLAPTIRRGAVIIDHDPDINFSIARINPDGALSVLGSGFDEVVSLGSPSSPPIIDLRLAADSIYILRLLKNGREICRRQFQILRRSPQFSLSLEVGGRFAPSESKRVGFASVCVGKKSIHSPERLLSFAWKAQSSSSDLVFCASSSVAPIPIPHDAPDGIIISCQADIRGPHAFLSHLGEFLCSDSSPLILN